MFVWTNASIVLRNCRYPLFRPEWRPQEEGWQIQRADYGFKNQRRMTSDAISQRLYRDLRLAVNWQSRAV